MVMKHIAKKCNRDLNFMQSCILTKKYIFCVCETRCNFN